MYCKYCKQDKLETEFEVANTINGKKYRRLKCRKCKQETQNIRRISIRDWLTNLKKNKKCVNCGNKDYRVLDFHHIKDKIYNIGNMPGYSIARIKKELKKCIVLCANCHRIKHFY